jgi:DNA-binding NtrC family response regulator
MQAVLLRFLETGEIQRVGSHRVQECVDVRIIAATNRNLLDSVAAKEFREDLYYRLNVVSLHVPPLRERPDDILPLLDEFFARYAARYNVPPPSLSTAVVADLLAYHWPGNVRELKNLAERLIVRVHGRTVTLNDLGLDGGWPRRAAAVAAGPSPASAVDTMYERMRDGQESFWSVVYPAFMARDLTRRDLRQLVTEGLAQRSGNYRMFLQDLHIPHDDYKKFLSFLRKYQCHEEFQQAVRAGRQPKKATRSPEPVAEGSEAGGAQDNSPVPEPSPEVLIGV